MRLVLKDHPIAWASPSPLWADAGANLPQPAILRFVSDDFMEELQRLLAADPEKLRGLLAVPETWRGIRIPARTPNPAGGQASLLGRFGVAARRRITPRTVMPSATIDAAGMGLKLYQPAHQRFYLVSATLVCQQPGLPDRRVDKGKEERASFVIRRYFPPASGAPDDNLPGFDPDTWTEHAFVAQTSGGFAWQTVAHAGAPEQSKQVMLQEEERLPLFPMNFVEDDRRTRRLLGGLIPVGRREAYLAAARIGVDGSPSGGGSTGINARLVLFRKLVSEPWKALVGRAATVNRTGNETVEGKTMPLTDEQRRRFRADAQISSWLILADFADYLGTYLPSVRNALRDGTSSLPDKAGAVLQALKQTQVNDPLRSALNPNPPAGVNVVAGSMAEALGKFIVDPSVLRKLEAAETTFGWPADPAANPVAANPDYPQFLFPLADADNIDCAAQPDFTGISSPANAEVTDPAESNAAAPPLFKVFQAAIDSLAALVIRAIEPAPDAPTPAVPIAAERPADPRAGWFIIRCVYERPGCGKLHDDVVSASTEPFQLAGFFDPDAPARPIRIGLPIDTTPAGLRKFDKNTAFVMSDVLCGQIARLRGLTFGDLIRSVLPWPLHKDLSVPEGGPCKQSASGPNLGLICSLSIPIITLCALILLIIMVSLLDFVFRWMPYFIICFPLPGLRAKPKP